jgi:hypothetical protein
MVKVFEEYSLSGETCSNCLKKSKEEINFVCYSCNTIGWNITKYIPKSKAQPPSIKKVLQNLARALPYIKKEVCSDQLQMPKLEAHDQ